MKSKELRQKSPADLDRAEAELSEAIFRLKIKRQVGQTPNPAKIGALRTDRARVKTIRHERAQAE